MYDKTDQCGVHVLISKISMLQQSAKQSIEKRDYQVWLFKINHRKQYYFIIVVIINRNIYNQ